MFTIKKQKRNDPYFHITIWLNCAMEPKNITFGGKLRG